MIYSWGWFLCVHMGFQVGVQAGLAGKQFMWSTAGGSVFKTNEQMFLRNVDDKKRIFLSLTFRILIIKLLVSRVTVIGLHCKSTLMKKVHNNTSQW